MRTSRLALFPMDTFYSSEFVIEGGNIVYGGGGSTEHADRRVSGFNLATGTVFDPRGTLDGYPVRCVKPL